MSTIYTDGAGNKYLGDCRWANHDISYPSTNYLKSVSENNYYAAWRDDIKALLISAGYLSMTWDTSTESTFPTSNGTGGSLIYQVTTPVGGVTGRHYGYFYAPYLDVNTNMLSFGSMANYTNVDYAICAGTNSLAVVGFNNSAPHTNYSSIAYFYYFGSLINVNPNFSYYTPSSNCAIYLSNTTTNTTVTQSMTGITYTNSLAKHYIASAQKNLLQTGDAIYPIACSDGQTATSQWATDMHVFDNNATLGYPRIGTVPNMLLGTGTYTYLKPVKIGGSVFPDGGSPWYLPVGTYAGKTLLMRCYSSQT